ncbi:MAG: hypothetical protein DMF68_09120 [Acidobacteria bacterium]|nr:MAG: hypothetical protein DMF68_09120 [Acidobacteriota bacterium]
MRDKDVLKPRNRQALKQAEQDENQREFAVFGSIILRFLNFFRTAKQVGIGIVKRLACETGNMEAFTSCQQTSVNARLKNFIQKEKRI